MHTALNGEWAFWDFTKPAGLYARSLKSGEIVDVAQGSWGCDRMEATKARLVCTSLDKGRIYTFDPEDPKPVLLDDGGALQTQGYLSIDGTRLAWIDYRDPPGQGSTYDAGRNGGEVYMHDFTTSKTTRLTFDSPNNPRGKVFPAVGADRAVWTEPPAGKPQNPSSVDELYGISTTLAVLDLQTGSRCRSKLEHHVAPKTVDGHHVYAAGLDPSTQKQWVFDIDLDDPAHEWECAYAPEQPAQ
jgi:hypothetical protein